MMIIDKKIAYVKKKELFEPLISTIPVGLNPIVFIEDTREMWTCGTYFSIGYPSIEVSEESGSVKVEIGNSFFLMSTTGESLSVRRGDGNRIIFSSNALNRVDTDAPLEWVTAERKLVHKKSGTNAGSYGQSTNLNNASVFSIPNVTVDEWGHITDINNRNVSIRDYVEQIAPSSLIGDRNVLLAYSDTTVSETAQIRKANGMTYNDATKKLGLVGGLNSTGAVNVTGADLTVIDGYIIGKLKGDVEGSATPKIHLSLKPEYGGSSLELYGHVKLQDILNNKPKPSTSNENINNTEVEAIAASPLMVWNAIETAKEYADSILGANNAMLYKGAIEAGLSTPGTYTPAADIGNTYVVTFGPGNYVDNVGYVNGEPVEVGDLLICKEATAAASSTTWTEIKKNWTFVQTNTTGVVSGPSSSVIGQLAVFSNSTGKLIKGLANGNVGQILAIGDSGIPKWENKPDRLNHQLKFRYNLVDFLAFDGHEDRTVNFIAGDNMFITVDTQGNITLAADPGSDTVNTAGATNLINRKLFLIGAESQTTSPQTYSNQYVYVGTDNCLYSNGTKVSIEGHTHLYAGSLTAGGAALKIDLNPAGLAGATHGTYGGIVQDSSNGPTSSELSNRLKVLHNNETGYYTELAHALTGTEGLWHRRNTAGVLSGWVPVIDKNNFHTYLDDTYIQKNTDPNQLKNFVRYSLESGLTMNWTMGNATPTHVWGAKDGVSGQAYVFSGDNIRAFANAVNRAGDIMTGALGVAGYIEIKEGNNSLGYFGRGTDGTSVDILSYKHGKRLSLNADGTLTYDRNRIWDTGNLIGRRDEHSHSRIDVIDNREEANTPQSVSSGLYFDFKSNTVAGLSDGGSWVGLLTLRKYGSTTDWSGGKSAQLGVTDNSNLWIRFGTSTAWEAWQKIATTSWADGKFLPLTGGMLSGALVINPGAASGNYNEGLRLGIAANGWSNMHFGGDGSTGGLNPDGKQWLVGRNPSGQFLICPNNSIPTVGLTLNIGGDATWYGSKLWHSGNLTYSVPAIANNLVQRSADGYIYSKYINTEISDENDLTIGSVYVRNDTDTFLRRMNWTTFVSRIESAHTHGLFNSNFSISQDTINSDNFRSQIFGTASAGAGFRVLRWNNTPAVLSGLGSYGTGIVWANSDTHGFLALDYHSAGANAKIGGGNGNNINWSANLWHTGNFNPDTKVNKAGDTMTGVLNINTNGVNVSLGALNGGFFHIYNNSNASPFIFNKDIHAIGDFYGGNAYNRRLAYVDEIHSQVGGSKSAQMLWNTWGTDTYGGAIQIREYGNVTTSQSAWGYAPSLSFHWGGRHVKKFGMRYDGLFAVDDVPISMLGHNHDDRYKAFGGNWSGNGVPGIREWGWTSADGNGEVAFKSSSNVLNMIIDGMIYVTDNCYPVWHSGNDGSSSGLDADLLDGVHNGNVTANYYNTNSQQVLTLASLDPNTWYPCVLYAGPHNSTPCRVTFCNALSSNVPSWSTHDGGFSFQFDFDWIGGGWGTIPWYLRIYRWAHQFANDDPCYGLEQRNNRSALVLYLRGGGNYQYRTTDGRSFTVYTSNTNIGDSTYPDNVAPRTSRLNNEWEQEANSRYGTCAIASLADRATVADSVERANLLSSYSTNPDGSHPGYGAKVFYSWNIGQANNSGSGYSNGITIGSNPGDQAYGFQIVQNMWDDRTYTRRYNTGWQGWKALATTEDVANAVPRGTIIMYLGSDTPSGWEDITSLFDGRFPCGAGTMRYSGFSPSVKSTYYAGVNGIGGEDYTSIDGDYLPNHYHSFVNGTNNYWGGTYTEGSVDDNFRRITTFGGSHNRGHDSGESTSQALFRTGSKCNYGGSNYNTSTYSYITMIPKFRAVRFLRKL